MNANTLGLYVDVLYVEKVLDKYKGIPEEVIVMLVPDVNDRIARIYDELSAMSDVDQYDEDHVLNTGFWDMKRKYAELQVAGSRLYRLNFINRIRVRLIRWRLDVLLSYKSNVKLLLYAKGYGEFCKDHFVMDGIVPEIDNEIIGLTVKLKRIIM